MKKWYIKIFLGVRGMLWLPVKSLLNRFHIGEKKKMSLHRVSILIPNYFFLISELNWGIFSCDPFIRGPHKSIIKTLFKFKLNIASSAHRV